MTDGNAAAAGRDVLRAVARYRAYALVVVAALVLAFLPSVNGDDLASTTSAGAGQDVRTRSDDASTVDTGTGSAGGIATATGGVSAAGTATGPRAASTSSGAAPVGSGIGSAEALASPDCDAQRGRLRVSSVYAPPCAVPWPESADNGGATSTGVTGDTIKVVALRLSADTSNEQTQRESWADYVAMYEALFRTWGRKVETIWYQAGGSDEAAQRADAIQIATLKPFAVLSPSTSVNSDVLVEELASRKIIVCCYTAITLDKARALAPHLWGTVLASPESLELNFAQYAGRRLWGRPARWAGDASYRALPRKFGLIYPDTWTDLSLFNDEFAKHGGTLAEAVSYAYDSSQYAAYQERSRTIIAKLKAKGVTTVLNAGGLVFDPITTREATSQQWFPEWVIAGTGGQDLDMVGRLNDPVQWRNAFGVASLPVGGDKPPPSDALYDWYWGGAGRGGRSLAVQATTVFFLGIHGAGPNLTPKTFEDALFAFPPSGGAASGGVLGVQISFGRHGFFPWDDFNQGDDFAEVWWDPQARGKDTLACQATGGACTEAVGKYRYLNGGRRYAPGQWPAGEPPFFDTAGTALWYSDNPPGDTPPSYPCKGCPSQGG